MLKDLFHIYTQLRRIEKETDNMANIVIVSWSSSQPQLLLSIWKRFLQIEDIK